MHLEIITPVKVVFKGEVNEIIVNTADGQIGILPHHINLFSRIVPGELIIKAEKQEISLAMTGGFLEVANNKITILADYAVHAEEIDVEKAVEAQKRAEEILKKAKESVSERDFAEAQAELRRALLELNVANRRRRRNPQ